MSARTVPDDERRARLGARHAIHPVHRAADPVEATRSVVVLHSTEPATVHLSVHARVDGVTREQVVATLETERSLVKQLAMRRTLFVFPRDLLPAAWGSAAARTAGGERGRLHRDLRAAGLTDDPDAWLAGADAEVLDALAAAPEGLTMTELRAAVPTIDVRADLRSSQLNPGRFLTLLGADARVVRGANTTHWRIFRPRWRTTDSWLGEVPAPLSSADGYAELVRRWLARFGPGTETDLVWWLGATKGAVRAALAEVGAVEVSLESGAPAYLLPDDVEPVDPVEPWAALLPVVQDDDATVAVRLLEDVPAAGREALRRESARLTAWLAGERVGTVYPSPAMRCDPGDLTYPVLRA